MDTSGTATSTANEDISEQIAVEEVSEDVYISKSLPQRTGNTLRIAYGGCVLPVMIQAACNTVRPQYQLFSCLGSFLGPTSIDHKIQCRVRRTRDTRAFSTRIVYASQTLNDGSTRLCAQSTLDFHVTEAALFMYGVRPPPIDGHGPEDERHAFSSKSLLLRGIEDGHISRSDASHYLSTFALMDRYFDSRVCATSISAQTILGLAPQLPTSHDHTPITQRPQIEWSRLKCSLGNQSQNWAALAFYMDGGLSFLPLHLDHKSLSDAAACSTMDFAFRIVSPKVAFAQWHLRERRTMAAAGGRTLSEAWLWDVRGDVVATMSQTSIMRVKEARLVEKL